MVFVDVLKPFIHTLQEGPNWHSLAAGERQALETVFFTDLLLLHRLLKNISAK